jgi:uncharacterized protein (TIGR02599 family)
VIAKAYSLFCPRRAGCRGFSLIELSAASAISLLLIGAMLAVINHVSGIWTQVRGNTETFAAAADAFDSMTQKLSQAVLNTYWSYDQPARPTRYVRASELHFVLGPASELLGLPREKYPGSAVFFQAPLGRTLDGHTSKLTSRLNAVGYFTAFGPASGLPAFLDDLPSVNRFRLFEWMEPTGDFSVYTASSDSGWFRADAGRGEDSPNASVAGVNVIGFYILAEYPLADGTWKLSYTYDSRDRDNAATYNQLPPRLRVVLVAIDDASASRLAARYQAVPPPITPPDSAFRDPAAFETDLKNWEAVLAGNDPKINFRIFSTTISIPNSRWSVH